MADIIQFTIKNATWEPIHREGEDIVKRMRIVCAFFHCCCFLWFFVCLVGWLVGLFTSSFPGCLQRHKVKKISQKRLTPLIITAVQDMQ